MKRIKLLKKGALIQKCHRLEIRLSEGSIIQRDESSFEWIYDPIPFYDFTSPYNPGDAGYSPTLDEAMRALVRAAMS